MKFIPRGAALGLARMALKAGSMDPATMTADQFMSAVFGPNTTTTRLNAAQLLQAYSKMPWFRAVVDRVAWSTSVNQWQLFVQTEGSAKSGGKAKAIRNTSLARSTSYSQRRKAFKSLRRSDSLREITSSPVLDFLAKGNAKFPGQIARQVTQQHLDMVGEGLWVLERNGAGLPVEYWPIPSPWILRRPSDTDPTWLVTSPRGTQTVPPEDMLQFYHPDPADPYATASGLGQVLGDELETDEYAAKHLKRWFKNFARPDVLVTGEGLKKEEMERLEERWLAKLTGKPNTPYFANKKLDVNVLTHSFAEMQLSQLRKDERDIIIHVYGVPPEIFGILENSNRATIDAADYLMAKYVIVPRLEFMRIILQVKLVEQFDERLILEYVSPIPEDREFEQKVMEKSPFAFTINEHREMAGRPPLEGVEGEGYVVPFNVAWQPTLDAVADMAPPTPAPAV